MLRVFAQRRVITNRKGVADGSLEEENSTLRRLRQQVIQLTIGKAEVEKDLMNILASTEKKKNDELKLMEDRINTTEEMNAFLKEQIQIMTASEDTTRKRLATIELDATDSLLQQSEIIDALREEVKAEVKRKTMLEEPIQAITASEDTTSKRLATIEQDTADSPFQQSKISKIIDVLKEEVKTSEKNTIQMAEKYCSEVKNNTVLENQIQVITASEDTINKRLATIEQDTTNSLFQQSKTIDALKEEIKNCEEDTNQMAEKYYSEVKHNTVLEKQIQIITASEDTISKRLATIEQDTANSLFQQSKIIDALKGEVNAYNGDKINFERESLSAAESGETITLLTLQSDFESTSVHKKSGQKKEKEGEEQAESDNDCVLSVERKVAIANRQEVPLKEVVIDQTIQTSTNLLLESGETIKLLTLQPEQDNSESINVHKKFGQKKEKESEEQTEGDNVDMSEEQILATADHQEVSLNEVVSDQTIQTATKVLPESGMTIKSFTLQSEKDNSESINVLKQLRQKKEKEGEEQTEGDKVDISEDQTLATVNQQEVPLKEVVIDQTIQTATKLFHKNGKNITLITLQSEVDKEKGVEEQTDGDNVDISGEQALAIANRQEVPLKEVVIDQTIQTSTKLLPESGVIKSLTLQSKKNNSESINAHKQLEQKKENESEEQKEGDNVDMSEEQTLATADHQEVPLNEFIDQTIQTATKVLLESGMTIKSVTLQSEKDNSESINVLKQLGQKKDKEGEEQTEGDKVDIPEEQTLATVNQQEVPLKEQKKENESEENLPKLVTTVGNGYFC